MSQSILAIDYGDSRVGVARASTIARLPEPLVTLSNDEHLFDRIQQIVDEEEVSVVVVGLPRSLEGVDTDQTKKTRTFIERLRELAVEVIEQDEAVTSEHAITELHQSKKHFDKSEVDQLAAVYILQDYLTEQESHRP
jgi:putative Holliday junction resolvase